MRRSKEHSEMEAFRLFLVLLFRILREQEPSKNDKPDCDTGDREPGSKLIHCRFSPSGAAFIYDELSSEFSPNRKLVSSMVS
jgi:hypothetical protein